MSRPAHIPESLPVRLVTPDTAREWLATRLTDYERQLRRGRVEGMARDMKDGRFHFIGDPVRFDGPHLVDGQHRLSAVAESGVPQYFPIVNVPPEAQHVIDTGAKRTVPDMLKKLGIATGVKAKLMTSIANKVNFYDLGWVGSRGNYRPTADESVIYIQRNQVELEAAADVAAMVTRYKLPVSASSIAALWVLCRRINQTAADDFWINQVIKGVDLKERTAAFSYRDRILRDARAGNRLHPDDALLYGAVAWNHHRQGNEVAKLQAPRGGFTNRALTLR